jgi:SAM-dependent methyltransferase
MRNRKPIALDAYEKLADSYAKKVEKQPHNAYLEHPTTLSLLPNLAGKLVLEAGCGPGHNTEWLLNHGASVYAFDISPKMLEHARKRVGTRAEMKEHNLEEPLYWVKGVSIDVVLASLVMDYIEDWHSTLIEFRRVLKRSGCLIISCGHPAYDFILKPGDYDYFQVQLVELWWRTWGEPVLVPNYRRSLMNITETLHETGFLIERMIEARPTMDYKRADLEGYEKISERPSFISIKAIPK